MLYAIPTFKGGFSDFTIKLKSIVLITDIGIDLNWINLDVYEYNLDSDMELPATLDSTLSLLPGTFPLSAYTYATFIDVVTKIKTTSKAVVKE